MRWSRRSRSHRFDPVKTIQWRNRDLDFASLAALKASLDLPPTREGLTKAPPVRRRQRARHRSAATRRSRALAELAASASRCSGTSARCPTTARSRRPITPSWSSTLFGFLARDGVVSDDWFAGQVAYADRTDGDIDTLANRIAHIRTWTFVANRPNWLRDPAHWQERTRAIEDRLSDALHERLTAPVRRPADQRADAPAERERDAGSRDHADRRRAGRRPARRPARRLPLHARPERRRSRRQGAPRRRAEGARRRDRRARRAGRDRRQRRSRSSPTDGTLRWQGAAIARLVDGDDALKPRLILLADDALLSGGPRPGAGAPRSLARQPCRDAAEAAVRPPRRRDADAASRAASPSGWSRISASSTAPRSPRTCARLDQDARAGLRALGVRFGAYHIYVPPLLKPAPSGLLAMLWALKNGGLDRPGLAELTQLAASGRTSVPVDPEIPAHALSRRRLPDRRQARRAHRHSRAPRRSHPPADRLAADARRARAARRRGRRQRLHRDGRHDLAARLLRRGLRVGAARVSAIASSAGRSRPKPKRRPRDAPPAAAADRDGRDGRPAGDDGDRSRRRRR